MHAFDAGLAGTRSLTRSPLKTNELTIRAQGGNGYGVPSNSFIYLDSVTLAAMLVEWKACLTAIATGLQSYSIAGRSFTRANLSEVSKMVADLSYAIAFQAGTVSATSGIRRAYVRMNSSE